MEAYLDWQSKSGGIKLNDVIEEFKYVYKGQEVKAGDFVNYINGVASKKDYGESVDIQLSTTSYSGNIISAVQLDENRIFIAHQMPINSTTDSTSSLYGVIVTVNGSMISSGEDTLLVLGKYSGHEFSATLLENGNVFIAYMYYTGSNYQVYGMVCSATGTTITILTNSQAINASYSNSFSEIKVCVLPSNKIFIAYGAYTNSYLYCSMCSISDNTITKGNELQLSTQTKSGIKISTCLLPNGNVFIAHSYGANYFLYGIVCTISGTTITAGSDTAISTSGANGGKYISTVALPNGQVFIAHSHLGSYLRGIVCNISETTITLGLDTPLIENAESAHNISAMLIGNNKIFITRSSDNTNYYLNGTIVNIDGTTITVDADTTLIGTTNSGQRSEPLMLTNGMIFIPHSQGTSYYLYAQIFGIDYDNNVPTNHIVITEYEQQVTPAIEPPFNAIALSSGVGGTDTEHNEQVKIARVYKEAEVTKTGNVISTSWTKVNDNECIGSKGDKLTFVSNSAGLSMSTDVGQALSLMCDGDETTMGRIYRRADGNNTTGNCYVEYLPVNPIAITKIKLKSYWTTATSTVVSSVFEGSKDGIVWTPLHTLTEDTSKLVEININTSVMWNKYRFNMTFQLPTSGAGNMDCYEFQTSEYIAKEVIQ